MPIFDTFKRIKRIPAGFILGRVHGEKGKTGDAELIPVDGFLEAIGATIAALQVTYDNTVSGLTAIEVQSAIDELVTLIVASVYTNENAQDAVGTILADTAEIDLTYNDGAPSITADLKTTTVVAGSYGSATQVPVIAVDSKGRLTSASNTTITFPAAYTNEEAQDAVGGILTDTATIDLIYNDIANTITADVINGSITFAKMQAITDGRLLGASGGTVVEEISVGAGLSLAANSLTSTITQYTDEMAQDAIGVELDNGTAGTIIFAYADATPLISATLKASGVTAATYGSATQVPVIAIGADGRITSAVNTAMTMDAATVTFSPTGTIAATNAQAAIAEVSTEAVSLVRTGTETMVATTLQFLPAIGSAANVNLNTEGLVGCNLFLQNFRADVNPPAYTSRHARGTRAAPTALLTNDRVFSFVGQAQADATTVVNCFSMYGRVIEVTPSTTAMNTEIVVDVCPLGSVVGTRLFQLSHSVGLQLYGAGNVVIDPDRVFRSRAYTVATLPAGVQGKRCHVTDALAPVALAVVAGGGAVVVPVFYNGAAWIVA